MCFWLMVDFFNFNSTMKKKEEGESNLFLIVTPFSWAQIFYTYFHPIVCYLHSSHDMSENDIL